MYDSDDKISKLKVEVQIELEQSAPLLGWLYVKPLQRLSDLLNDDREFLPLRTCDGLVVHLRKATIHKVTQLDQEIARDGLSDPYEILGVTRQVGDEDLKAAYHDLCSRSHPDKLVALGLCQELVDSANSRMIRIIDAYRRILELRNGTAPKERPAARAAKTAGRPVSPSPFVDPIR